MIIATADLHLTGHPADEYRWSIFDKLIEVADASTDRVTDILILGDLTEKKDGHTSHLVNRMCDGVRQLARRYNVHILAGNHDYVDGATPYFRFLRRFDNVRFYSQPTRVDVGEIDCLFLPHDRSFRDVWRSCAKGGGDRADAPGLVCFHQAVEGATNPNGFTFGEDGAVTAKDLQLFRGAVFIAGDIHTPQVISGVTYCGSPHPVDYGDDFEPRVLAISKPPKRGGIRIDSVPMTSVRKLNLTVTSKVGLDEQIRDLTKADMVKVVYKLDRASFVDWPDIRAGALASMERRGIIVGGLALQDANESPCAQSLRVQTAGVNPSRVLLEYCRTIGVAAKYTRRGLKLLEAMPEEIAHKALPGNLQPEELYMEGFRSFVRKQSLSLARWPGLYCIAGINEASPRMGANATGKSSIWDALCWCCYGKTVRGLGGADSAHWGGGRTRVGFRFKKGDQLYRIIRSRKPSSLTLRTYRMDGPEDRNVTQDELDALLGLTYGGFLSSVMMGQFNRFFFDLSPSEKLDAFSSALDLDYWNGAVAFARKRHDWATEELAGQRDDLKIREGEVESLLAMRRELTDRLADAEKQRKTKKKEITKRLADLEAVRLAKQAIHDDLASAESAQQSLYDQATDRMIGYQRDETSLAVELGSKQARERGTLKERAVADRQYDAFDSTCPVCGSRMGDKAANRQRIKLRAVRDIIREKCQSVAGQIKDIKGRQADLADRISRLSAKMGRIERDKHKAGRDRAATRSVMVDLSLKCANLRAELEHMEQGGDVGVIKKSVDDVLAKLSEARKAVAAHKGAMDEGDAALDGFAFWEKQFKALRLHLIKQALEELEIEVNNNLLELDLRGWTVGFDIERENKSGGISRGFNVSICSPDHKQPIRWESWSGGETQRLRVAGAKGLANLIRARRGARWDLEVWDEPFAHLSDDGARSMLALLQTGGNIRQVWVIEHRPIVSYGQFRGIVTVTKTKKAGSIISEDD